MKRSVISIHLSVFQKLTILEMIWTWLERVIEQQKYIQISQKNLLYNCTNIWYGLTKQGFRTEAYRRFDTEPLFRKSDSLLTGIDCTPM